MSDESNGASIIQRIQCADSIDRISLTRMMSGFIPRRLSLVAVGLLLAGTVSFAQGDLAAIQQKLNAQFKLTTITADRSDIATSGDVVQIHRPGLMMYAVASPMPPSNTYKNGKIGQGWGGFGKDLAISMATPGGGTAANYPHRPMPAEEKCWVIGITVQSDGATFELYSDPYDDIRYYANLKIPFPNKREVPTPDSFLQTVAEVLTAQPAQPAQADQGGQTMQPQSAGQSTISGRYFLKETGASLSLNPDGTFLLTGANGFQSPGRFSVNGNTLTMTYQATGRSSNFTIQGDQFAASTGLVWVRQGDVSAPTSGNEQAPAATEPAMAPIAPPPPPADESPVPTAGAPRVSPTSAAPAQPPTISLGDSKSKVIAAFGQPQKVVKLPTKEIDYYQDMKVTYVNGKVSAVD